MAHSNNFDGLRLTAASMVLISHQFALSGRPEPGLLGVGLGALGLAFFFAISGFLVSASWANDPHPLRFSARRFLRIWPGLTAVVLVTSLALLLLGEPARAAQYWRTLAMIYTDFPTFLHNPNTAINGSLWTIPVEVNCYLALLALAIVFRKLLPWAVGLAWLMLWTYFLRVEGEGLSLYFIGGAVLQAFPRLLGPKVILGTVVVGLVCAVLGHNSIALHLLVPALCVWVGLHSWRGLSSAGRFGDMSYGLYVWGFPIQQLIVLNLGSASAYPAQLGATLLCVVPTAWLSWHLIEKPAMRLKPRSERATSIRSAPSAV